MKLYKVTMTDRYNRNWVYTVSADSEREALWKVKAVCHGDCLSDAEYAADLMRKKLGKKTTVHICYTGAVIGSHSGPGTLALFFMGDQR